LYRTLDSATCGDLTVSLGGVRGSWINDYLHKNKCHGSYCRPTTYGDLKVRFGRYRI